MARHRLNRRVGSCGGGNQRVNRIRGRYRLLGFVRMIAAVEAPLLRDSHHSGPPCRITAAAVVASTANDRHPPGVIGRAGARSWGGAAVDVEPISVAGRMSSLLCRYGWCGGFSRCPRADPTVLKDEKVPRKNMPQFSRAWQSPPTLPSTGQA